MRQAIFTLVLNGCLIMVLMVLVNRVRVRQNIPLVLLFLGIYFSDNLIIIITNQNPSLQLIPNHVWAGIVICSWSGKLYSILASLALAWLLAPIIDGKEIGLTFQQECGSMRPSQIVLLTVGAIWSIISIGSSKGPRDFETLAYMAIIPGLNEELVYRGLLLALLNRIFPKTITVIGSKVGWGVIISAVLFGLLHGLWLDNNLALHLQWFPVCLTIIMGIAFAWQKERTGSLFIPIITHGVVDFLAFVFRMR